MHARFSQVLFLTLLSGLILLSPPVLYSETEPINFVALLPLTGSSGEQGAWLRRGIEMAEDEVNKVGKQPIKIIYEDVRGDPKTAVSAYKNLKLREKFPVVITWGSGVGLSLTPLVNHDKIIQMGVATATPLYTSADDFTFRNYPSSVLEARETALTAYETLKARSAIILQIENDYGEGAASSFEKEFLELGGEIIGKEAFLPNQASYRSTLVKLSKKKPDIVYLASYTQEAALILRQAYDLKLGWKFIGAPAVVGGKNFVTLAGKGAEGLVVVSAAPYFNDSEDPSVRSFVERYRRRYNETPDLGHFVAAIAYDAVKLLAPIAHACEAATACIRDKLFQLKDYPGVGRPISFDNNGDIPGYYSVQILKNGHFIKLHMSMKP